MSSYLGMPKPKSNLVGGTNQLPQVPGASSMPQAPASATPTKLPAAKSLTAAPVQPPATPTTQPATTAPAPATQTPATAQPVTGTGAAQTPALAQWQAMGSLLKGGGQTTQPVGMVSDAPTTPTTPVTSKPTTTTAAPTLSQAATPQAATTNTYDPNNPTAGLQGGEVYGNWTYTVSPITGLKQWVNNSTGETMGMSIDSNTGQYTMQTPPEVLAMLAAANVPPPDATLPPVNPNPVLTPPGDTSPTTPVATATPPQGWTLAIQGENGNLSVWTGPDGKTYLGNEPWNDPDSVPLQDVFVADGSALTGPPLGEGTIPIPEQPTPVISPIDPHFGEIENPGPIDPGGYGTPIPGTTSPPAPPGGTPITPPGSPPPATPADPNAPSSLWDLYNQQKKAADEQWGKIENESAQGLAAQLRDAELTQSLNARRANEMNAMSGQGAYGGAAQAGQAQAQLGGLQLRNNAIVDQNKRMVSARQTYLQGLMDSAAQAERLATTADEAQKARDLQLRLQKATDQIELAKQMIDTGQITDPAKIEEILNNLDLNP